MRNALALIAASSGLLACRLQPRPAGTLDLAATIQVRKARTSCYKQTSPNLRLSGEYYRLLGHRLHQLVATADTLFIIEAFNAEFGSVSNSLITRTSQLDFVAYRGTVEIQDSAFDAPLYELVRKWDLTTIKALAAKRKMEHDAKPMRIYRLHLKGNDKADCLYFQQFHF